MTITFSQLDGDIKVPTIAVETDLEKGRTGLPSSDKKVLCIGYPLAAGSATNNKLYQTRDVTKARNLFGEGSQLAVMVEKVLNVDPRLDVWCFPVTEDTGSGVAASEDIVFATEATGNGAAILRIGGRTIKVGIQTGDSADDIGENAEAAINALTNAPFTGSNSSGTVTITARNKGAAGNSIKIAAEITAGIGTTVTPGAATLSSGANDTDPATPLVELRAHGFEIVALANGDATTHAAAKTHMEYVSDALRNKPGIGIWGDNGAQATLVSEVASVDSYRMQAVSLVNCPNPEFEIAAVIAGMRAAETRRNMPLNYLPCPGLSVPEDKTDWPTDADLDTALDNGITPLKCTLAGEVQIVRSIITRVSSPAFIDHNPLEISDYIDKDLIEQARRRYGRAPLKSLSPAGTADTLTPDRFEALLAERMLIWDSIDYVQGSQSIIEQDATGVMLGQIHAEINGSDPNRLDVGYPFVPTWGAHVIAIKKTLTLPPINVG